MTTIAGDYVPVWWWNANPDAPARGYWDQAMLTDLLGSALWHVPGLSYSHHQAPNTPPDGLGAVVVVPGGANAAHVAELNEAIAAMPWVLLIITSDEEHLFPLDQVQHPNIETWRQYPRADVDHLADEYLPIGYSPAVRDALGAYLHHGDAIRHRWSFAGQVTHERREAAVRWLREWGGGVVVASGGFAQGLPADEYARLLATTKIAPCPSGHVHVDSFRCWEALEAGAVPIVDSFTPTGEDQSWFWTGVLAAPFQRIEDWASVGHAVAHQLDTWPASANVVQAWWGRYKRQLAWKLADAIGILSGSTPTREGQDAITVLIPTSPIPAHPSIDVLAETLASVRERLPHAEILIVADGVRPEQEHRRAAYDDYLREVTWQARRSWHNVAVLIADEFGHQANTTRWALRHVRTPLVLFVEHDTPLVGNVPWSMLAAAILDGDANAVRLHYDVDVHPDHWYLYESVGTDGPMREPLGPDNVQAMRTRQWSQRPHLASADWYRRVLADHFPESSRTMIEDKLHGVLQDDPWEEHRVWVFAPSTPIADGGMKRSTHLDARGEDPKYPMVFG